MIGDFWDNLKLGDLGQLSVRSAPVTKALIV